MNTQTSFRMIGGNNTGKRAAQDFYPTPPDVVWALLDFLKLPKTTVIWEPAAGEGDMMYAITRQGYHVIGTDIADGQDFLTTDPPENAGMIITNPPFSMVDEFIRRADALDLPFALLVKSQCWHAAKRMDLFEEITPTYILPLTWRPDFMFKQAPPGRPLMDVMWCVWMRRGGCATYLPLRRPAHRKEVDA